MFCYLWTILVIHVITAGSNHWLERFFVHSIIMLIWFVTLINGNWYGSYSHDGTGHTGYSIHDHGHTGGSPIASMDADLTIINCLPTTNIPHQSPVPPTTTILRHLESWPRASQKEKLFYMIKYLWLQYLQYLQIYKFTNYWILGRKGFPLLWLLVTILWSGSSIGELWATGENAAEQFGVTSPAPSNLAPTGVASRSSSLSPFFSMSMSKIFFFFL